MRGLRKGDRVAVRDSHHGRLRGILSEHVQPSSDRASFPLGPVVRVRYDAGWTDFRFLDEVEPCSDG